jgi:hydrogenase maturation protein HypF
MARAAKRLLVRGVVQGVGFRPFVFRLATGLGLAGSVRNLGDAGVEIVVEGPPSSIDAFVRRLETDAPALAQIESVKAENREPTEASSFVILASGEAEGAAGSLPPDIAVCAECLTDLRGSGRYAGYWATTCTNCGPRFTVIDALPYDRPRTSMVAFPMCPDCQREYTSPTDRRYHAQTIACPRCGPTLRFDNVREDALKRAREALDAGRIVAVKGIGGTHLCCDAMNGSAVERLRERVGRPFQPLAIMATETVAERIAEIDEANWAMLRSPRRPIVVVPLRSDAIPQIVAPGLHTVGIMLPYSGLHHFLLDGLDRPLVMTSANRPGRPMLIDNEEIVAKLNGIADHFLLHDRRIAARCDDSVVRRSGGEWRFLRRSRGYVPEPIPVALGERAVLALGGETDVAVALYADRRIVLSQHIGSVDNPDTLSYLHAAIEHLLTLTGAPPPEIIACDRHPQFLTTQVAAEMADRLGAAVVPVQHHKAHAASVLAEHGLREGIGVILDGYGYGEDGTAWGGELFVVRSGDIRRAGSLAPIPLAGGDRATRHPLRLAAAYLLAAGRSENEVGRLLADRGMPESEAEIILQQIERGVNAPPTTSAGRFLDAVAALLGICTERTYEGEPAMRLEAAAARALDPGESPPIVIRSADGRRLLDGVAAFDQLAERAESEPLPRIAASAQHFLADGFARMAAEIAAEEALDAVAFSGGVAYNDAISHRLRAGIESAGLRWLTNRRIPCGDGGVSFGQAVLAAGGGRIPELPTRG